MGETITIRTGAATEVIKVIEAGPQGPVGPKGDPGDVAGLPLTTTGDTLYRANSTTNARLPIGTAGQVLKVNSTATAPEWGAASSVDLTAPGPIGSVTPNTGAFTTLSASGTATLPHIHGSIAGNLYIHVKNVSGGELARGTPVYIVGNVGDTDRVEVAAADFDDATRMPAVGLLEQTLANNGTGDAVIVGELANAATNTYSLNQELFVGNNGTLTTTRPTTGEVQSVGTVGRVHASTGVIVVNVQGRRSPNETFAAASHTHGNITNDGKIGTTAGLPLKTGTNGVIEAGSFGTSAGTFCEGNDSRLSDSRTPTAHAASHLPSGADELFNQSLNTTDAVQFTSVTVEDLFTSGFEALGTGGNAVRVKGDGLEFVGDTAATSRTNLGAAASGSITSSGLTQATARLIGRTSSGTGAVEELSATDVRTFLNVADGAEVNVNADWNASSGDAQILNKPTLGTAAAAATTDFAAASHTHAASAITSGTLDVARLPTGTTSTTVSLGNHGHELTSLAATGATNGHVLTANGSGGVTFAAATGGGSGVTAVGASTADVLSVSGSDLVADDAGADRIVFWDDSEGKWRYLEAGSGLSISGTTMTVTATGGATNLWIPASAWIPRTTSGCGVDSREIGSTNRQNFDELLFDTGSEEFAQALVVMPSNYNNSTLTARFYWTASSGSGGVAWGISGRAFGDDDAIDQATGTRIVVTDTLLAANDVHVTAATSAVTIDGTPAANKAINFQISRVVADAADTLAVDARFLGAEIIFN